MSTDSLTVLNRIQQRRRLTKHHSIVLLGNGLQQLQTLHDDRTSLSLDCDQPRAQKALSSLDEEQDDMSLRTLPTTTNSYNTSAKIHEEQPNVDHRPQRIRRMSRSHAEHGKHRHRRKRHEQSVKVAMDSIHLKRSFLRKLLCLRENKRAKSSRRSKTDRNANSLFMHEPSDTRTGHDRSVPLNCGVDVDAKVTKLVRQSLRSEDPRSSFDDDEGFLDNGSEQSKSIFSLIDFRG